VGRVDRALSLLPGNGAKIALTNGTPNCLKQSLGFQALFGCFPMVATWALVRSQTYDV
jgi:hypothetical protein